MNRITRLLASGMLCVIIMAERQPLHAEQPAAPPLRLHPLFTDNMVLQQGIQNPVWGWAGPGRTVTVSIEQQEVGGVADADGAWQVDLEPLPAGGPFTMTVTANKTITLENVMVGEVWVASGQSNMQWPVKSGDWGVRNRDEEIAAADYPGIRLFTVPRVPSFEPQETFAAAGWQVCTPETVPGFSAAAYFFGRYLHNHLGVPVGLIHSSWGGTVAEAWTSKATLATLPDFAPQIEKLAQDVARIPYTREDYERKLAAWRRAVDEADPGYRNGEPYYANPELDDSDWETMELPQIWEKAGLPDFDGYMWFRKTATIPPAWVGKPLILRLGPIDDMDRTWFNGALVGSYELLYNWETPRVYPIPADLVKTNQHVIAVRVYDNKGEGGICGDPEDLVLQPGVEDERGRISLAGPWRYKPGLTLKDAPTRPGPPLVLENNPNVPSVLYNGMIAPLIPYGIRGAIWYQGESNAGRAYQYRALFPAMIEDWRSQWGQGPFPFLFVQLANFLERRQEPGDSAWAELREAQWMTLRVRNTGMATAVDIGEAADIHPQNKQDVGKRLGLAARHVAYGEDLVYSGPAYRSMVVEGDTIRLRFDHVGGGLVAKDGPNLAGFAVAGKDRQFVWADAHIDGDTVVVSSGKTPEPVAVRYAWADNPVCSLYNKEGLPALPFRTDDWPGVTMGKK